MLLLSRFRFGESSKCACRTENQCFIYCNFMDKYLDRKPLESRFTLLSSIHCVSDPRWQLAPVSFLLPHSGQSSATHFRHTGISHCTGQPSTGHRNRSCLLPLTYLPLTRSRRPLRFRHFFHTKEMFLQDMFMGVNLFTEEHWWDFVRVENAHLRKIYSEEPNLCDSFMPVRPKVSSMRTVHSEIYQINVKSI